MPGGQQGQHQSSQPNQQKDIGGWGGRIPSAERLKRFLKHAKRRKEAAEMTGEGRELENKKGGDAP